MARISRTDVERVAGQEACFVAEEELDRRGHVGFLMPAIEFCFEQAGWEREEIDAVAVDVGPGPFTGIRAGIATAQAFAAGVGGGGDLGLLCRRWRRFTGLESCR